jgi:hypothetical protein
LLWRAVFGVMIPVLCEGDGKFPGRLRDCIVYRAGQKRIVRGYLDLAREAVMEDLQRMQQLLGESEGKE